MNDILVNMGLSDPSPEDCDPVVREVVEETRAAVDEMMKELNDHPNASSIHRDEPV